MKNFSIFGFSFLSFSDTSVRDSFFSKISLFKSLSEILEIVLFSIFSFSKSLLVGFENAISNAFDEEFGFLLLDYEDEDED